LPLIGNARALNQDRLAFFTENRQKYGEVVHFRLMGFHAVQINRPDLIQEVLVQHPDKFNKSPVLKRITREILGDGLLTSDGEQHKRQRKLIQPVFHHARIAGYGDVMVQHTARMLDRWQTGETIQLEREMMRLTLGVVAKTLFDADVESNADEIGDVITQGIHFAGRRVAQAAYLDWLPTKANRERKQGVGKLDAVIFGFIEERRKQGHDRGDLLSMLLAAADEQGQMSNQQVRNEAMTLFIAGHETTANALSWAWYLLAQHPAALATLQRELDSVLGGRAATAADLPQLKYAEMVIKEAMRLYPPAWIITRRAVEPVQIGPYLLPANTIVIMSPYLMHRDAHFFPDPERFQPERWASEMEKQLPRYAYFPFGGGPRICIGNGFAMMEAVLILATMAQRYQLDLVSATPIDPEPLITLRPKQPIMMRVAERAGPSDYAASAFSAVEPSADDLVTANEREG
jgi:cytochrome P450